MKTEIRNTEKYKDNVLLLLQENNLLKYPIDVKVLAEKLGIQVNYSDLSSDISGRIEYYNKNTYGKDVIVTINQNESELRQNFSLAHEIGHYIYDINFLESHVEIEDQEIFLRSNTMNPIEKRANKFAEKILMPLELFNNRANEIKNELFPNCENDKLGTVNIYKIISKLSEDFKVSKPAVIMRLFSIKKITLRTKNELFYYHSF